MRYNGIIKIYHQAVKNVQTIANVEMIDYNIAAVTEPETACFGLKTATEIVIPIENNLIWPKQPVQMSKRKIERLPSIVTSETWQKFERQKSKKSQKWKKKN